MASGRAMVHKTGFYNERASARSHAEEMAIRVWDRTGYLYHSFCLLEYYVPISAGIIRCDRREFDSCFPPRKILRLMYFVYSFVVVCITYKQIQIYIL